MVREQLQWLWRRPVVHTSVRGSTLTVSGSCPDTGPVNRCKADIDLAIPFDADVVVQGDSGDISAERLAGHLKLTTDSGDVSAQDLNAISVAATTNAGDVDVAFTTEPVSVSANSQLRRRPRHRAPPAASTASTPPPPRAMSTSRAWCATTARCARSPPRRTRAT